MKEEARQILRAALTDAPVPSVDLAARIRSRFAGLGDVELTIAKREPVRTPPPFGEAAKPIRAAASKQQTRTRRRA